MASSKEYLDYVLGQLSELDDIATRAMMGEFIIYYKEKVIGGIYDNRFLVKPVKAAKELMPVAPMELPYEGAKPMILVENMEDRAFLAKLFRAMEPELPAPKKKRR
ncbi:MAG: TfoX/Sxy family protein [Ruminococcus sp.]|nr:TfoX/Sxy family protein [Ruminococcus sp.]